MDHAFSSLAPPSHLFSLLPFLKNRIKNTSHQCFLNEDKHKWDGTLKNQPNNMRMTPQYFHTIPTSCVILPTEHHKTLYMPIAIDTH